MPKSKTQKPKAKLARGFNVMKPKKRIEIARKGGLAISKNRKHMREIAALGGAAKHRK